MKFSDNRGQGPGCFAAVRVPTDGCAMVPGHGEDQLWTPRMQQRAWCMWHTHNGQDFILGVPSSQKEERAGVPQSN